MKRCLALLALVSVLGFSVLAGTSSAQSSKVPHSSVTGLDKEAFLTERAEDIAMRRGIHEFRAFDRFARPNAVLQLKAALDLPRPLAFGATWTELGPDPIPNAQVSQPPTTTASGRTISIAVDPSDEDLVYVGTAQGGLYKSTDGGTNWTRLFDSEASLAIGAIAIAPSDPSTVYVGTGEHNFSADSFFGVGVYRIDSANTNSPVISGPFNQDGGASDVFTGRGISKILVHPTDPGTIFVATTSGVGGIVATSGPLPSRGIYRSTNATSGAPTFTKLTGLASDADTSVRDIALDPLDPDILVANTVSVDPGIYHSTNALSPSPTFTQVEVFSGGTSDRTAEFAVQHTAGPDATFYAATGNGGGRVLRSTDGGATWTQRIDNNFCTPQCFYDIAIAVDPTNADNVYLGGAPAVVFAFSTNGGTSFTESNAGVHVDTHAIAVAPSDLSRLYLGTDGGIYRSDDGGNNWTSLNNSQFTATQFMDIDTHPTDPHFAIGGTQDNGTNFYRPDESWFRADFGDGGYTVVDQNAPDTTNVRMYHTYFNATTLQGYGTVGNVAQATDGGWAFRGCQGGGTTNGITCNGTIRFYAPLERGPGNPNTIYYASDRLYRSDNLGVNHTVVSQNPITSGVAITAIGIAPQDDDVRVVGQTNGGVWGTTTGSSTLTNLDPSNTIPDVPVARVAIDPTDSNTAFLSLSAFGVSSVWKTENLDGGPPIWTDASGGLPQVPVNVVLIEPDDTDTIYAGTDIGVYVSTDAGASWTPYGTGLPVVAVFGMARSSGNTLKIATHGRGFWEVAALGDTEIFADGFESGDTSVWSNTIP